MADAWHPRDDGSPLTDHPQAPRVPASAPASSIGSVLPDGWAEHRRRVRRGGAVAALILPAVLGVAAGGALVSNSGPASGLVGVALAVAAAPLLPVAGVPATAEAARVAAGVAGSALVWMMLGLVAARRATRVPGASWPEWRRSYMRLAAGAIAGGWLSLLLAAAVVGLRAR